ncbi:DUF4105 domain-containing protein [Jejudonia soesokkakensis]|uniref:DUF4105 domain-containing protein n=1 Tax=Jejudonia soesokkakensis TaxID=1323432 RepID=A0ABW2MVT0_9FLAO
MFKKLLPLFCFFLLNTTLYAQYIPISEDSEISILTVGPGEALYDKFGHSAFRVKDNTLGYDIVYNYGTYDFETPNFYTKFAQGKLLYELSFYNYEQFLASYKRQNRWIKEQVLELSLSDKEAVFNFLQNNAKDENKAYKYDFFFDNCATRMRDVLKEVLGDRLQYNDSFVEEQYTFRELIQKNVHCNSWGSLGMDVATGAVTDRDATAWQYQFLPNYVYQAATTATLDANGKTQPLVKETNFLFKNNPVTHRSNYLLSPLFIFSVISIWVLWITFRDLKRETRSRFLDAGLLFITGVVGIILALLWFATDHSATANNYNLLWAFPFSILVTAAIAKRNPKAWVSRYIIFLLLLFLLLTIHWITGVQEFAIGLLPLFMALAIRYIYVVYYLKRKTSLVVSRK